MSDFVLNFKYFLFVLEFSGKFKNEFFQSLFIFKNYVTYCESNKNNLKNNIALSSIKSEN